MGGIGLALDNPGIVRIGTVADVLVPTDGMWRGAMYSLQDPAAFALLGSGSDGSPFLSQDAPSAAYLAWAVVWTVGVWLLCALSVQRRDL